jgi:ABC-2 type transport system ATP-binding protein
MGDAITIEGLSKYYGTFLALNKLSLKIKKGDFVGFLGPNGAGKSTTIKILCGLIQASSGNAYINDVDVRDKVNTLSDVGAIVEIPEFYPYFTPEDTLSYLGQIRRMKGTELRRRIKVVLEQVKLEKWSNVKIGKFSRGMKQRLGVAQALLHDPSILILDEPASGLDPRGISEVREIVKQIRGDKTVFLASHILAEVTQICEKVAVIDHGRLLVYDSIGGLEKKFFGGLQIEVEISKPLSERQLARVGKLKNVTKVERKNGKILIDFSGDRTASADLLDDIRNLGHKIVSFTPSPAMLEEIYLKLVEE